jgi:hypothetical protein
MKLVKRIIAETQLLEIDDFDLYSLLRAYIADFKVHDIFAILVKSSVSCLPSLLDSFFVFSLRLFFLFDDAFDPRVAILCDKFVDAGFRIDRKVILHLHELLGGVLIDLEKSDVGNCIDNLDIVLDLFERSLQILS